MTIAESPPATDARPGTIGDSVVRPDGVAKTQGTFSFSSDHACGEHWYRVSRLL